MKNIARIAYHVTAAVAFATVIHAIGIVGLHDWQRQILGLPIGQWIGWGEIAWLSGMIAVSAYCLIKIVKEGKL